MLKKWLLCVLSALTVCGTAMGSEKNPKWTDWDKNDIEVVPKKGMTDSDAETELTGETLKAIASAIQHQPVADVPQTWPLWCAGKMWWIGTAFVIPMIAMVIKQRGAETLNSVIPRIRNPLDDATKLANCLERVTSQDEADGILSRLDTLLANVNKLDAPAVIAFQDICLKLEACKYKDEVLARAARNRFNDLTQEKLPEEFSRYEETMIKKQTINTAPSKK